MLVIIFRHNTVIFGCLFQSYSGNANTVIFGCLFQSYSGNANTVIFGCLFQSYSGNANTVIFGCLFQSYSGNANTVIFGCLFQSYSGNALLLRRAPRNDIGNKFLWGLVVRVGRDFTREDISLSLPATERT
jgi:hypothetical protein